LTAITILASVALAAIFVVLIAIGTRVLIRHCILGSFKICVAVTLLLMELGCIYFELGGDRIGARIVLHSQVCLLVMLHYKGVVRTRSIIY
jgi:hypothetical protein